MFTERSVSNMDPNGPLGPTTDDTGQPEEVDEGRWTGRFIIHHDWSGSHSLWSAIVDALSTVTGVDRSTVTSVYSRTHARLIEQLFRQKGSLGDPGTTSRIRFDVVDCR